MMTLIGLVVSMLHLYLTLMDTSSTDLPCREILKSNEADCVYIISQILLARHGIEEDTMKTSYNKHLIGLLVWHVGVKNVRWYIKPQSTY